MVNSSGEVLFGWEKKYTQKLKKIKPAGSFTRQSVWRGGGPNPFTYRF